MIEASAMVALHSAVAAVAPIDGVSVGVEADKSTWKVSFADSATPAQRAAAQTVINGFDLKAAVDPLSSWDRISLRIAFNHENRIRVLEGKQAITLAQFKAAVLAQVG